MKKFIAGAAALALTISCAVPVSAAASSRIAVSGGSGTVPVSFLYDEQHSEPMAVSIKKLLSGIDEVYGAKKITQTISVQSISVSGKPVNFMIRLAPPQSAAAVKADAAGIASNSAAEKLLKATEKPAAEKTARVTATEKPSAPERNAEADALDYYDVLITALNGDVVYDYRQESKTPSGAVSKDIPLPQMNNLRADESAVYKITVSADPELAGSRGRAAKLDWQLVAVPMNAAAASASATAMPVITPAAGVPTAAPVITQATAAPVVVEETAMPIATMHIVDAEPTAAPVKTAAPAGAAMILKEGTYTVGEDIAAGRYEITGDSKVRVYTSDGTLKTNISLTEEQNSDDGVTSYVLTLRNGERVELLGDVKFTAYSPSRSTPKPTATPRRTATPKPTASPRTTPRSTSTPRPSSSSNPKTGDTAPVTQAAVIGTLALAAAAAIEIYRRKKR